MPHKNSHIPKNQIQVMDLNGLKGRFLNIDNKKKSREILLIYGHHSSLERIYGIAEALADFGNITAPDLPGFGGMDSLYKIGIEPDFDSIADYLAAFIKTKYKNKKFTIAAFSIGFAIVTRMLQKYPEIASRVDILVSVAGFTKRDDFKLSKGIQLFYRLLSRTFSGPLTSYFFRHAVLNTYILKIFYRFTPNARHKFKGLSKDEFNRYINFEVELWHNNEVRTYLKTSYAMLTADLTGEKVDLKVHHISIGDSDQYFNNEIVEKHLNMIYNACIVDQAKLDSHMPSVIASKSDAQELFPSSITRLLNRKSS